MEKVAFTNSRNVKLAGNFYPAYSKSIVILCHGFTSDKTSKGRFEIIAGELNQSGIAALAFDFSGCGESGDDSLSIEKEADDLSSAIDFVKTLGFKKIGLYGHSLGSLICLKNRSKEVKALVLSGALTGPMLYDWKNYYSPVQLRELRETGFLTVIPEKGKREKIVVEGGLLAGFEKIDPKELFSGLRRPVLLIHGNTGWEENRLRLNSEKAVRYLPKNSSMIVLDGADHSFLHDVVRLAELANDWFVRFLIG